jgi:uncharacterized protein YraI
MSKKLILPILAIVAAILACNAPSSPAPSGGIVQGVVYGDLNSDGDIDDSEQSSRVEGVTVTLDDCGPTQTQLTDSEGKFRFEDLPEGSCHVSVSKGGWIYIGSFPALGVYPIPVASDPDLPTAFSIYMAPVMDFIPTETPTLVPSLVPTLTSTIVPTLASPMVTPTSEDVNCRFGPGTEYLAIGSLRMGEIVPIRGTISDRSWWQIEDPRNIGILCWVKAALTTASGNLALVPELAKPTGLVTDLAVSVVGGPTIHGFCGGPNAVTFSVSITTNGPATVKYHLEIFNGDGSLRNATADATLNFTAFGTQTFDPAGAYKTDCGDFYVKVIVTAPNSKTAQYNWSVVYP